MLERFFRRARRARRSPESERGAILVMTAAGLALALVGAALAVDLGRVAQERRFDQKVADLAALDAVRDVSNAASRAQASAIRNRFAYGAAGHTLLVRVGTVDAANQFVELSPPTNADAVEVTVSSPVSHAFVNGGRMVTARAVARTQGQSTDGESGPATGSFSLGSALATIDTSRAALLNPIIGQMLCGTAPACAGANANLSAVSWQGLANGSVTLSQLQTELARLGYSVGTTDQLMSASLTMADLFRATANALTNKGDLANAAVFNGASGLTAKATTTNKVKLGDMVNVAQGMGDSALGAGINTYQLVTGSAQVANGNHAVEVPSVGINVPGVASTSLRLSVIEKPVIYIGPVDPDGRVRTGQVNLTVTPNLSYPVTIPGLVGAKVTRPFAVTVTGAGAEGWLKAINCSPTSKGITVSVDAQGASASGSGTLRLSSSVLGIDTPLLDIPTTGALASTATNHGEPSFSYPTEFSPPAGTKHVGGSTVGLETMTLTQSAQAVVLGPLPGSVADAVSTVYAGLRPVLGQVDSLVVAPLMEALGLDLGSADVAALPFGPDGVECGGPALVS